MLLLLMTPAPAHYACGPTGPDAYTMLSVALRWARPVSSACDSLKGEATWSPACAAAVARWVSAWMTVQACSRSMARHHGTTCGNHATTSDQVGPRAVLYSCVGPGTKPSKEVRILYIAMLRCLLRKGLRCRSAANAYPMPWRRSLKRIKGFEGSGKDIH